MSSLFPCACCGYLTCAQPTGIGSYDICEVCFWEDDGVQFDDPEFAGGANRPSLNKARENFRQFGACELRMVKHVRPPRPDEIPPK